MRRQGDDFAYVIGAAATPFRRRHAETVADLAARAARQAMADARVEPSEIDAVFAGTLHGGEGFGQSVTLRAGIAGPPIINLENACASSAVAVAEAALWIRAGIASCVLVVGGDVLSDLGSEPVSRSHGPYDYELHGMSWPVHYALEADRAIRDGHFDVTDLAEVAVSNRANASRNPNAQFTDPIDVELVLTARSVASPLTMLMCSPRSDGAAAVIVSNSAIASGRAAVRCTSAAIRSGQRLDGSTRPAQPVTQTTSQIAFEQAGIGPGDVDVVELHDAFASAQLEHLVALGLCSSGEAPVFMSDDHNRRRINPSGGLMSRGHPVGATGCAQVGEIYRQLTAAAGERQIDGATWGVTHTMGGTEYDLESNVCIVQVFERC